MNAVTSISAKPADMLQPELRRMKRRIPQWDNSLNVVVQRIILNERLLMHVAELKN